MLTGLDLWSVPEVMIGGIKFKAKKKKEKKKRGKLGESHDLGLPVWRAEVSPHIILQGESWAGWPRCRS